MSFEIQPPAASAFNVDPQVGANEIIASGDTLILSGGNAAIRTSNGGADTVLFSLVLDPAPTNMLSITGAGLLLSSCAVGGFLDASNGSVGISDTVDIGWLAGRDLAGCLAPVNLTNQLIPFGNNGAWAADALFKYDAVADRLFAQIFRTTNPPVAPTLPILAYVENANGDIGKLTLPAGDIVIGGASGEVSTLAPGTCAALTQYAVNGLAVNPVSGAWENLLFRGKFNTRAVAANTALVPATDYVLQVNNAAGNIIVTLTSPAACEPNDFHIKQVASLTVNSITLTPAVGLIEGAASYVFGNTNSAVRESRHVYFDGTNWHII